MAIKLQKKLICSTPQQGTQTNTAIVIHNTAGGTAKSVLEYFGKNATPSGERPGIYTHYVIDDKEVYQLLEDNWKASHCKEGNAHYAKWGSGVPNIGNGNAIGIEVADGSSINHNTAIENVIELARYLMQVYNIPLDKVVRHGDVQDKPCPETIMKLKKWDYIKDEIKKRNDAKTAISLDMSEHNKSDMVANGTGTTITGSSGGSTVQITFNDTTTVQESLPNANTSDNWVDMHKIKGITLHMYPPYHNCVSDSMQKHFKALGWNRNFHYKVDKDTKIDFSTKPVSGQTTGGNVVGSSNSDFEVKPKDPLYSGVTIGGGGSGADNTTSPGTFVDTGVIAESVWFFLLSLGYSKEAAAGVMGNMHAESGVDPTSIQSNGKGPAAGICQWENYNTKSARWKNLNDYAKGKGKEWTDLQCQLEFLDNELQGGDSTTLSLLKKKCGGYENFKKLSDVNLATKVFEESFERAGIVAMAKRQSAANDFYNKFKDKTTASSGATTASVKNSVDTTRSFSVRNINEDYIETYTEDESLPYGWPLVNFKTIQSYFGYRTDESGYVFHPGIDIACYPRSIAHAYYDGTVVSVLENCKYDTYIKIDHGNNVYTCYGSITEPTVKQGDKVYSGQFIGYTSNTRFNGMPHLHFELWINGERVDPLKYVMPGGGNKQVPEELSGVSASEYITAMYGIEARDITNENDEKNIVWDNIDKGKIVFALANNNKYTYIHRAMFNNQAPKYTLSIGAFFYDEYDLPERSKNVDWPKTERKLIQQCAKSLYDEGFTSKQLWREFDLNRAPSPFLYLDQDKWIDFCAEVDKQVEWLVAKYGKVTAAYVPNNLLTDENNNEFVETAPDGGTQSGGDSTNDGTPNTETVLNGKEVEALYTGYYPANNALEGGMYDALGNKLDPSKNTCAAPKEIPFHTKIQIKGTGTDKDGQIYEVTDRGGAITVVNGVYHFDLIFKNNSECNTWGKKKGKAIIGGTEDEKPNETLSIASLIEPMVLDVPEPEAPLITDITADPKNVGKYCYMGRDDGKGEIKDSQSTDEKDDPTKVEGVSGITVGKEMKIISAKGTKYGVSYDKTSGVVDACDVAIIAKAHGEVNKNKLKKVCYVKWNDMDLYKDKTLTTKYSQLKEKDKGVVTDLDEDLGLYKVVLSNKTGWIKAYCLTFNSEFFKIDDDYQTNEIPSGQTSTNPSTPDDGTTDDTTTGQTNADNKDKSFDTIKIEDGDFENNAALDSWDKEGKIDLLYVPNPAWGTSGHWPYRGLGFGRIRNTKNALAGISHKFKLNNLEETTDSTTKEKFDKTKFYSRVLFYVKPVTQEDTVDGPTNPNTLKNNGITIKILDSNNKVLKEANLELNGLVNTVWKRVGYVFTDLALDTEYKIFIGGKKNFDLYIDDIVIDKVYVDKIDNTTGDEDTSSGIGNSGTGTTSKDNGGIMVYTVGKPTNTSAKQPDIQTIITQEEYDKIMVYADPILIDEYVNSFEPYDKDLPEAKDIGVLDDDRYEILTEECGTLTNNIIKYRVVETGPGSVDHCVKPVDELSVLLKNNECKVEPVYPDLVIPPKYTTSDLDIVSKNTIPLLSLQKGTAELEDVLNNTMSYDYSLLAKKTKESSGRIINYDDPYPYDDKITELEEHAPKVLIDEIESRVYSCNHPGCPIAHPMAKNFTMLNDMAIKQSKSTEQRLVKLENSLAFIIRNLGRLGSRMNINCVYYGGQTVLGKYKGIRCMHDDRIHDGASVTIDQCMCCTRYEPIIGQIYDILDETGFNGSAILDDMQMSYMSLDDVKNLNNVERRSTKYDYVNTNKTVKENKKPTSLIDDWKKADKKSYEDQIKKTITDKNDLQKKLDAIKETDYVFRMDWTEEFLDQQRPDVKVYPTEKIAAKYYNQAGDKGESSTVANAEQSTQMGVDKATYDKIADGEWVDTRAKDDSMEKNKYTSLDYYFENFNLNRTGYEYDNGLKGNVGLYSDGSTTTLGSSVGLTGSECRDKIIAMAKQIVNDANVKKDATYSNVPRTVDYTKPARVKGTHYGMTNPVGYDCTSFVSCCYKAAGLTSMYQKSCSGGTLVKEILNGGEMWLCDDAGIAKAIPGDVLVDANSKVSQSQMGKFISTHHALIYMGDGKVMHSSKPAAPPNSIKESPISYYKNKGTAFFCRPKDLIEADAAEKSKNSNTNTGEAEK